MQRVWFRDSARRRAIELGITGWVKNRREGDVEIVAEGPESSIAGFIKWCRKGPPNAVVTDIDESMDEYKGEFDSFDIVF